MRRLMTLASICLMLSCVVTLKAETYIPGGSISGTWTAAGSPYMIQGDVAVVDDSTLIIEPGVDVIFQGYYFFVVNDYASLTANGTVTDSIRFMPQDTAVGWVGLKLHRSPRELNYCAVRYAKLSGVDWNSMGGTMLINHCSITNNHGVYGGGVTMSPGHFATLTIRNSTIAWNTAGNMDSAGHGGGIFIYDLQNVVMDSCLVDHNGAFHYSQISTDTAKGGGIYISQGYSSVITNSFITNNYVNGVGGNSRTMAPGLFNWTAYESPSILSNCVIKGNWAGGDNILDRSGVTWRSATDITLRVSNCEFSENAQGLFVQGIANVINCTFTKNGTGVWWNPFLTGSVNIVNSIFTHQTVRAWWISSGTLTCRYTTVHDAWTGGPAGIGVLDTVNANGDSCDTYFNIFMDPMFADTANDNYHLQAGSPCIDAGDPASPYDPDGTVADMGAYYFDQSAPVPPEAIVDLVIRRLGENAELYWSPVVSDTAGNPIAVARYVVYAASEPFVSTEGDSIGFAVPPDTMFVHGNALDQGRWFYRVRVVAGE